MCRSGSQSEWEVMLDYSFIRNYLPGPTPAKFRRKHTKQFLSLFHPDVSLTDDDLNCMKRMSSDVVVASGDFKKKLDLYYADSGVSLHHVLIAPQKICAKYGSPSKPAVSKLNAIVVYTSLSEEPGPGSVIPSRCTKKDCGHWGNNGWDVCTWPDDSRRLFKPLKNRHTLPY